MVYLLGKLDASLVEVGLVIYWAPDGTPMTYVT